VVVSEVGISAPGGRWADQSAGLRAWFSGRLRLDQPIAPELRPFHTCRLEVDLHLSFSLPRRRPPRVPSLPIPLPPSAPVCVSLRRRRHSFLTLQRCSGERPTRVRACTLLFHSKHLLFHSSVDRLGPCPAPYFLPSRIRQTLQSLFDPAFLQTAKMSTKSTAVFLTLLPLLASIIPTTLAQTSTDCNPLNSTNCPIDTALGVGNYSIDFTTSTMSTTVWNTTDGTVNYGNDGAEFTIAQRFDAPTVQSNFYLFFGTTEVIMQTAPGQGIISSIVLLSDDLDEIDWELMGGNNSYVETNYYGKGNQSERNALYYPIQTPEQIFHNYTVHWTAERLDWYIDGQVVRTLLYDDAEGGNSYPQTPMRFKMGIWAGGDPKMPPGTIAWAGGETDYSKAPFTMTIKSVRISDASRGTAYQYGDTSGTWESIKVLK